MALLIIGVALWVATHLFKRIFPNARASLGQHGYKIMALSILTAIVLMVIGFRIAPVIPVYTPPVGAGHLTALLMLLAIFSFALGKAKVKGVIGSKLRHPMLLAVTIFSIAHLIANGDLASIILFGTLGIWALVQMMIINTQEGPWARSPAGPIKSDIRSAVIAFVLYLGIVALHYWAGLAPFSMG